mmetsp:Transcript_27963/g.70295  ORF Transcript_27963/g.70295 Transcript_27963/m.70295 type:complete len:300 (-) Transcript_27963:2069-2968(-)
MLTQLGGADVAQGGCGWQGRHHLRLGSAWRRRGAPLPGRRLLGEFLRLLHRGHRPLRLRGLRLVDVRGAVLRGGRRDGGAVAVVDLEAHLEGEQLGGEILQVMGDVAEQVVGAAVAPPAAKHLLGGHRHGDAVRGVPDALRVGGARVALHAVQQLVRRVAQRALRNVALDAARGAVVAGVEVEALVKAEAVEDGGAALEGEALLGAHHQLRAALHRQLYKALLQHLVRRHHRRHQQVEEHHHRGQHAQRVHAAHQPAGLHDHVDAGQPEAGHQDEVDEGAGVAVNAVDHQVGVQGLGKR